MRAGATEASARAMHNANRNLNFGACSRPSSWLKDRDRPVGDEARMFIRESCHCRDGGGGREGGGSPASATAELAISSIPSGAFSILLSVGFLVPAARFVSPDGPSFPRCSAVLRPEIRAIAIFGSLTQFHCN